MPTFTLINTLGHRIELASHGAAIAGIFVPDAAGNIADITVDAGKSAGKSIGRYANRIAGGRFSLDGREYVLAVNDGPNTLHGGPDGFSHREWQVAQASPRSVEFVLHSPDGDQGFPGAMECRVRYTWSDAGELRLEYRATADAPTVVNLTNHVYFNLRGSRVDIADQQLRVAASRYTPLDAQEIPTGSIDPVEGSGKDFRAMRAFGTAKYDCNFVLDGWDGELRYAGEAFDPVSGRRIAVETTQPGLQLFTGKPGAFALETQHFADAPHHPNFPSTVLRPGEVFTAATVYRFGS